MINQFEDIIGAACRNKKTIWVTDRHWGRRQVIPERISNEPASGKLLHCYILLVSKLGDSGNRPGKIPLKDIIKVE